MSGLSLLVRRAAFVLVLVSLAAPAVAQQTAAPGKMAIESGGKAGGVLRQVPKGSTIDDINPLLEAYCAKYGLDFQYEPGDLPKGTLPFQCVVPGD